MLLGDLQARIENSDPDNADVVHMGPGQTLEEGYDTYGYHRARATVMEGRLKAFSVIPVRSKEGSWSVIIICNTSNRTGRTNPHILVARDQDDEEFADTKEWEEAIWHTILANEGEPSASVGQIRMIGGPTPSENRVANWIHTVQIVERVMATYHQSRPTGDHTVRAHTESQSMATAEMQARIRVIDDAYGPHGPERTAAKGVRPQGETFGVTLTEADIASMVEGKPVTDGIMTWGVLEMQHRCRTAKVEVCGAMLGHDILSGNNATELLTWHQCWRGTDRRPTIDYTGARFVAMPVKDGPHGWFLVIICHLSATQSDRYKPCALILDPRNKNKCKIHPDAVAAISAYMQKWRTCVWHQVQSPLAAEWLTAPQAHHAYDSGILVLHMIDLFARQCSLKLASGRLPPYGPFGGNEAVDQSTWFELRDVVGAKGARPVPTRPTLKTRLLRRMMTNNTSGDTANGEEQVDTPAWTKLVTSEPGTAIYDALESVLGPRVGRMMTGDTTGACKWSENDTRSQKIPTGVVLAVADALHTALMAHTWEGLGCNRTHALEGRGTLRVCSWMLAPCQTTGAAGWTVPGKPSTCPAALWFINLALSEGGRYSVIYNNGVSDSTLELQTQGEVCAFQGGHLDAGRVAVVTQGDTRLVVLCVGLAWNKPVKVMMGEHFDDHDPRHLRLVIDQEGAGVYSRARYGLVEGSTQRMRTSRHVCPRCEMKQSTRLEVLAHFQHTHLHSADEGQTAAVYDSEMREYWEWRRFDAVAQRILHVERECGVTACCPTIRRPTAPRPGCLRGVAEAHAIFEGGIRIGDRRRPARYLFEQGMDRQDVIAARELTDSQEGQDRTSAIHDISGKLGDTVRIIPYADEQALAYLEGRPTVDARTGCVLRGEDTWEYRKALHGRVVATIEALARKVGEPVKLRGFMELLISKPGAQGQDWHMDVYMGGWNFTWRIQGRPATRFMDIPYQGFPEYLWPGKSTLPAAWDTQPEANVVWAEEGDISMFRADAPHAGPANPTKELRIAGFIPQDIEEDVDDYVITETVLFPRRTGCAKLPTDAPAVVHKALAAARGARKPR